MVLPLEKNLRLSPEIKTSSIPTFLDFEKEGGFELAVDLCNGNGLCRKAEKIMCPSFQASSDEYHTTRARAQSLRAVIHGRLPLEALTGPGIMDVLDLCLECKGCKTECPSQVDMAKMKSEVLYQHYQKRRLPWRNRLFGHIGSINQLGSFFPSLFNYLGQTGLSKFILNQLGITSKRSFPVLAKQRFSHQFQQKGGKDKRVILFNDTYTEFNYPEIGLAAASILERLGYEVIVLPWRCCGRPLISKGMLEQARAKAIELVTHLHAYSEQGIAIVGLEPSCILTIKDDFPSLIGSSLPRERVTNVAQAAITLDEFLHQHLVDGELPFSFAEQERTVLFHGHCHQKALIGSTVSLDVLKGVKGFNVKEIDSGCCGVAGSFGYEKEHYEFSMKIGELRLLPAIRNSAPETLVVANGTSCRQQISHGTQRRAYHLAEAIANQIHSYKETT